VARLAISERECRDYAGGDGRTSAHVETTTIDVCRCIVWAVRIVSKIGARGCRYLPLSRHEHREIPSLFNEKVDHLEDSNETLSKTWLATESTVFGLGVYQNATQFFRT
jgi:hypothetical protein